MNNRLDTLSLLLFGGFSVILVMSNLLSAKLISLPMLNFPVPAGLVTYPLTFLISDFMTEIFGPRKARKMVYCAFGMCLLSVGIIQLGLILPAENLEEQKAFRLIWGKVGLRTLSSLGAFLISQIIDIKLFMWIKHLTKNKFLWFRANSSTWISQFVDTVAIDILFLYLALGIELKRVSAIILFSFAYKALFSLLITPLLYFSRFFNREEVWRSKRSFSEKGQEGFY